MKKYKFSKTYVAAVLYRYAFLLFVPVLQGLLFAKSSKGFLFTLYSTDLALLVLLVSVAVIRCSKSSLSIDKRALETKGGVIFKTCDTVILNQRASFLFTDGLFLRLMKGCRLRVFAGSGYSTAYLKQKDKNEIIRSLLPLKAKKITSSGIFRTLLMSLSFSNALTGLLAAVPLLRRVSVIMGAGQAAMLLEGKALEGILKFTGLPPVLRNISSVLFFFWLIGFFTEFFSEYRLKFIEFSSHFYVSKGLVAKTQAVFHKSSVRMLLFRQSILMFLLGFYSAQLRLNIKPRRKIHILSAVRGVACENLKEEIFGKSKAEAMVISPSKSALWGYTYLPFIALSISMAVIIFFYDNIIIKSLFAVLSGVFAVWFLFRFFALYRSSLEIRDDVFEVKYFSGMNFTRVVFGLYDVTGFEISQSLFQKITDRCNIKITVANVMGEKIKIKHISLKDIEKLKPRF